MNTTIKKPARFFGGKTEGFKNKVEKVFNQRMLRAYLKGHQFFFYGIDATTGGKKEWPVLVISKED